MVADLKPARLSPVDVLRTGAGGLRSRPLRVLLSALGIAIGIAAMTSVVGISASGRADLQRVLGALGTNLLTVNSGQSMLGEKIPLPDQALAMLRHVEGVTSVSGVGSVKASVYRTDRIPPVETNGLSVLAARIDLLTPVGGRMAAGVWLTAATERGNAVVLGASAARYLGIGRTGPDVRVWLGGQWFTVAGILQPNLLVPQLDTAALVGRPVAQRLLGFDGSVSAAYVRTRPDAVLDVRGLLARTANPEHPDAVTVSRPSDALEAQQAADRTLNGLLLGLGAVALLVGGVGVANTMIISVLERRAEIGLRRSLGATPGQIRLQFVAESLVLSAIGGGGGVLLGIVVTAGYAATRDWPGVVPAWAQAGGLGATLVIGMLAGVYPAIRASRLPPTEALATP
jgi:putative ABC transport system permease protein